MRFGEGELWGCDIRIVESVRPISAGGGIGGRDLRFGERRMIVRLGRGSHADAA